MSTFIDRLKTEEKELYEKAKKLIDFQHSDKFKELSETQQGLLSAQVNAMASYGWILKLRLDDLEKKL